MYDNIDSFHFTIDLIKWFLINSNSYLILML